MTELVDNLWQPPEREIRLDGQACLVRRMRMRQILALTPMLVQCKSLLDAQLDTSSLAALLAQLPVLVERDGALVVKALAVAADVRPEQVSEADPAEVIELASAVIEVNLDFSTQRLAPALAQIAGVIGRMSPPPGSTPSRR